MNAPAILRDSTPGQIGTEDGTATLSAAQDYAARGWPVFPLHSIVNGLCTCGKVDPKTKKPCTSGKQPTIKNWLNAASTDPTKFRWTRCNLGIRTGNGLHVIDVDAKAGASLERTESGWLLIDGEGNHVVELPPSRVHRTGGGGWHWYGAVSEKLRNSSGTGKQRSLGLGIDTRGDGGFVVAPPSNHISGNPYSVLEAGDLADLPESVLIALRDPEPAPAPTTAGRPVDAIPSGYAAKALEEECNKVASVPESAHNLNNTLNTAALKLGQLVGAGLLERSVVEADLLHAAVSNGHPEPAAQATIRSGLEAGIKQPRQVPERVRPNQRQDQAFLEDAPEGLEEYLLSVDNPDSNDSPGADGRKRLLLSVGHKNPILRRVARELRNRIYLRGDVPALAARLDKTEGSHGITHHPGGSVVRVATPSIVQFQVDQKFACKRINRHGVEEATTFPKGWSDQFVANAPELGLLHLDGIVKAPLFNIQTGQITTTPGYDRTSRLYVDFYGSLPTIQGAPSKTDCEDALRYLLRPFRGWLERFKVNGVALTGALLTAAIRPSFRTAPGIILDGNVPGCGKGLLGDCLGILSTGARPTTINEGSSAEELEKRIDTAILSGAPAIMLDNVQRPLGSSNLESSLTNPTPSIRIMRTQEAQNVPWRALVLITFNNGSIRADKLRRFIPVRIVSPDASPELIKFGFDPAEEVLRDRANLLAAAFTILRGRIANPGPTDTLGSFTEWADLVSGAVEWLMGRSVVSLIAERKAEDSGVTERQNLLIELQKLYPDHRTFRAKDAAAKLTDEWEAVLSEGTKPTAKSVGSWLTRHLETNIGGLRIERQKDRTGVYTWKVVEVPND